LFNRIKTPPMKSKPVRVCDVSRVLRLSSSSLIDFLRNRGYSILNDYLSPLSSRMVELIQTGYHDGPPFQELNSLLVQAEDWEKANPDTVNQLHTPPPAKAPPSEELKEIRQRRKRVPRISFAPPHVTPPTGRITLTPLDLEIIHRMLALNEDHKIQIRDYLRRKTILRAISLME
jgi:hypothetical protein